MHISSLRNIMSGNNNGKKIFFINHWARSLGGAEHSLIDIISRTSIHADTFLVTSEKGELHKRLSGTGVTSYIIPCTPNVLNVKRKHLVLSIITQWKSIAVFFIFFLRIRRLVKRCNPDIIHANVPKSHIVLFLLMRFGYHGQGIVHMREIFTRPGIAFSLYGILFPRRRIRVIAISRAVKNALPIRMQHTATVIYNGVHIPPDKEENVSPPPVRFLYLGRIVPWKGCHSLIRTFRDLKRCISPGSATLDLTGATSYWNQEYRDELLRMISYYNLGDQVSIFEFSNDPYSILSSHHVLCMMSENEPFGRVAAEALGAGLPVISYTSGGISEVIQHDVTGFLVKDNDFEEYKNAMKRFIDKPHLIAAMGSRGRRHALSKFHDFQQTERIVQYILH